MLCEVTLSKISRESVCVCSGPKPFGGQYYGQLGSKLPFVWNVITAFKIKR